MKHSRPGGRTAAYSEQEAAQRQFATRSAELTEQSLARQSRQFDNFFHHIDDGFRHAMIGVMRGTQTLGEAFRRMGADMAAEFAVALEKMVTRSLAAELQLLVAHQTTEAGKTAATSAASAERTSLSAAAALQEILHAAATAAAHAYSATAGIPFVGPVLAPAAGAAAFAGVMAFDALASAAGGWERVPDDQLAMVHKNEMVLPANVASGFRTLLARPSYTFAPAGAGGMGAGGVSFTTHVNVSAVDLEGANRYAAHIGDRVSAQAVQRMKRYLRTQGVMR